MNTIFNLDLNKKNPPTSFGYLIPANSKEMYFRIIENDYVIDYSKFNQLSLRFEFEDGSIHIKNTTVVTAYQNEKVVKYTIPSDLLKNTGDVIVTPTIKMFNKTVVLQSFKIVLLEDMSTEINGILSATNYFNYMLSLYYDSVKRDQLNKPNGVIGLDGNGDVPLQYFPSTFTNHIADRIIDTKTKTFLDENGKDIGIHGLKFDEKWRLLYFDAEDQEWYKSNQLHGGNLVNPQKSSEWSIYGGTIMPPTIDAMTFNANIDDYVDGGSFTDNNDSTVDANFIDSGIVDDNSIFGGTIV